MSEENVEQVHRITAAINRHDIDAVLVAQSPTPAARRLSWRRLDGGSTHRRAVPFYSAPIAQLDRATPS
jgi:hypothetical protein